MLFYDYFRSSAAFRVRIALNLKGLTPERHFVHLRHNEQRAPDYLKLNPQGLVPTLVEDGATLTQSLAIVEYLDEMHPEPPLLPADAKGRARVRAIAQAIACEIHPINNLRILNYLADAFGLDPETRAEKWYRHWVAEGVAGVEGLLAAAGTGRFCHGDAPTLADTCLVPQIFNAQRFDCPMDAYPIAMRVFETCMAREEFAAAQPSRQPDAEA